MVESDMSIAVKKIYLLTDAYFLDLLCGVVIFYVCVNDYIE